MDQEEKKSSKETNPMLWNHEDFVSFFTPGIHPEILKLSLFQTMTGESFLMTNFNEEIKDLKESIRKRLKLAQSELIMKFKINLTKKFAQKNDKESVEEKDKITKKFNQQNNIESEEEDKKKFFKFNY